MEKTKNILKFVILLCLITLFCVLCFVACQNIKAKKGMSVEELAEYGKSQFLENDFNSHVDKLRGEGISDLTVEATFEYDKRDDFDKENKSLFVTCYLDFSSTEIDDFYTMDYKSEKSKKITRIMYNTSKVISYKYKYKTEQGESITIYISPRVSDFEIVSSKGNVYSLWDSGDILVLYINEELVCMEEKIIAMEKNYSSLTREDKEQIIDYIYSRYEYYDEKEGRDTGNKYTEIIWQETMDRYGLTYEEVDKIWYRLD